MCISDKDHRLLLNAMSTNGSNMQKDLLVCHRYPLKPHNIIYWLEGFVITSEENDWAKNSRRSNKYVGQIYARGQMYLTLDNVELFAEQNIPKKKDYCKCIFSFSE